METIQTTTLIGQNTEKSPRDWKRLVVTQAPAEGHRLTLVGKAFKGVKQLCRTASVDDVEKKMKQLINL